MHVILAGLHALFLQLDIITTSKVTNANRNHRTIKNTVIISATENKNYTFLHMDGTPAIAAVFIMKQHTQSNI